MLNMSFDEKVVVETHSMDWEGSPMSGVWRKPLAREAAEHGHTTSIVKFDEGSYFSPHSHPLGEEILVLEGVFSDEHGDYPAGHYIRNPPGSRHKPFSEPGCVLLVKLDQFDPQDLDTVRLDTEKLDWLAVDGHTDVMPLHDFDNESVTLMRWTPRARHEPRLNVGGEEIYILSGELFDEYGQYPAGSWLRLPDNSEHCPYVETETVAWVKSGHLL